MAPSRQTHFPTAIACRRKTRAASATGLERLRDVSDRSGAPFGRRSPRFHGRPPEIPPRAAAAAIRQAASWRRGPEPPRWRPTTAIATPTARTASGVRQSGVCFCERPVKRFRFSAMTLTPSLSSSLDKFRKTGPVFQSCKRFAPVVVRRRLPAGGFRPSQRVDRELCTLLLGYVTAGGAGQQLRCQRASSATV